MNKTWIEPKIEELDIDKTLGGGVFNAKETYVNVLGQVIIGPQYGTVPGVGQ